MIKNFFIKNKEISVDYIWRLVQVMAKEGVSMTLFFVAVYYLSPDLLGLYSYIMAGVFFLIMFSDFGFSVATSTLVAECAQKTPEKLKNVFFTIGFPVSIVSSVVALVAFVYVYYVNNDKLTYFFAILPLFFFVPLTSLLDGILRGTRQFKKLAIVTVVTGLAGLFFGYFFIRSYGLLGAFYAQSTFFVLLLFLLLCVYRQFSLFFDKVFFVRVLKYSFIIGMTSLGYFIFTRINTIIIGQFGYLTELAHYEIIQKIIIAVLMPFTIFSQVLAPRITTLVTQENWPAVHEWFFKAVTIAGVAAMVIAATLFACLFYFEKQFSFGVYDKTLLMSTLLILMPVLVTQAISSIVATGFSTASGHVRINMYTLLVFGPLNMFFVYMFIAFWGYVGAVYATLIVKVVADVVFISVYYKILKQKVCQK